jgi:hypothetical protein
LKKTKEKILIMIQDKDVQQPFRVCKVWTSHGDITLLLDSSYSLTGSCNNLTHLI